MHNDIKNATLVLKNGGLLLFPDETGWGLGCDATNHQAAARILSLNKEQQQEVTILLENPALIDRYVNEVPEIMWDLVEVSVKPLTILLPGAKNLASAIIDSEGNIAIRITRDEFSVKLLQRFRRPVLFLPVNPKNHGSGKTYEDIRPEVIAAADYITEHNRNEVIPATQPGIIKLWPGGRIDIIRN